MNIPEPTEGIHCGGRGSSPVSEPGPGTDDWVRGMRSVATEAEWRANEQAEVSSVRPRSHSGEHRSSVGDAVPSL